MDIELIIADKIVSYSFIISIIALPFLLINWHRYLKKYTDKKGRGEYASQLDDFPYKSVLAFFGPLVLMFILSSFMTSTIRGNILIYLNKATPDTVVMINGSIVSNSSAIISELRKLRTYFGHHSHPEKDIYIEINERGNTLKLKLRRDSERPNEYWVYYPPYRHTSINKIGRITSNLFDSY